MAEKLKIVLLGVVLLLAAAVIYGYVDDGDGEPVDPGVTAVESPSGAAPAEPSDAPVASSPGKGSDKSGDATSPAAPKKKKSGGPKPERGSGEAQADGQASEGAGGPTADSPPSEAEFARSAEKICAQLPRKFAARAEQEDGAGDGGADFEKVLRAVAPPIFFEAARRFDRLEPPAGGAARLRGMVAGLEEAARRVRRDPAEALTNQDPLADFRRNAKRLGLDGCGGI